MFTRHFAHWPPGQPRTLELPQVSVYANLAASAAKHPERAAIDYYGSRVSYAELKRQVDALAGFLQRRFGVRRGDRVLLYAQNSPQFVIAYYAILRADAVVVPVNPMNRTEELRHYVEDSGAAAAIAGNDVLREIAPLGLERVLPVVYSDYLKAASDLPIPDFVRAAGRRCGKKCSTRTWRRGRILPGRMISPSCRIPPGRRAGRKAACTPRERPGDDRAYLHWRGAQDERSCFARCRCST